MKTETGTWYYNEPVKKIALQSTNGKVNEVYIISYTIESLVIKLEKATLVMERIIPNENDELEEPVRK